MSTIWRRVENKCRECDDPIGKFSIREGKIVVERYYNNWGCWQKVPGKSEMQVMCRDCQKQKSKELRKKHKAMQKD